MNADPPPSRDCRRCGFGFKAWVATCPACGEREQNPYAPPAPEPQPLEPESSKSGCSVTLIVVLTLAAVAYRLLVRGRLEQSALLFVGIPGLISVLMAFMPTGRSVTGSILRGIGIALCLSALLLGEGAICILMASPIALFIGLLVGLSSDAVRRKQEERDRSWRQVRVFVVVPLVAMMSLEGVSPELSFSRGEKVSARRVLSCTPAEVQAALARPPDFSRPRPLLLGFGFPQPVAAEGGGIAPGNELAVHFAGGEGKPGTLTLRVTESQPGRIRYEAVSDTSHIAHWMRWKAATVTWRAEASGGCEVQWQLEYDRLLDPAWYFGPAERAAAKMAAGYLIDALATP